MKYDNIAPDAFFSLKPLKMSEKERVRLTHQFFTDFPLARPGTIVPYENRNHFYLVNVYGPAAYGFILKIRIIPKNQPLIDKLRKVVKEYGRS